MKKELKVAIYAICKNEKQFVDKWFNSMLEGDYICVLDTGSTDGTYEKLLEWRDRFPNKIIISQKTIKPWRFDVARNESLKLVPEDADIMWCTDLDELLIPGWSTELKTNWQDGQTKGVYLYAWSHNESGQDGRVFWYDKIHTRGYSWRYPVHEAVLKDKNSDFIEKACPISSKVLLHHYPDISKDRSNYIDLLYVRLKEDPTDAFTYLYIIQDYFNSHEYKKCLDFILSTAFGPLENAKDALFMPNLYLHMGDCYGMLNEPDLAERAYRRGIMAFPLYRENYLSLAAHLLHQQRYFEAKEILYDCLQKTKRFYDWLERDLSWSFVPYDLLSQACFFLDEFSQALDYAKLACLLNPQDERLKYNVDYIQNFINQYAQKELEKREAR